MNVTKTTTTPCVGGTQQPKPPGNSSDFAKVMAEQAAGKEVALEPKPEPNYPICETKGGMHRISGPNFEKTMPAFQNTEGLEGDELFAAIVNHFRDAPDFFGAMIGQLYGAGLITSEEFCSIMAVEGRQFNSERIRQEGIQGKWFNLDDFIKNYFLSLSFDDLLLELVDSLKIKPEAQAIASKISSILSENNTQEVNINE
ncbi:MAG: hypothetical protein FWH04_10150 [Oscillospiraceae bacterium]|nr:hypothetical protein [Oscillospiraceae bacterium]